MGKLFSRSSKSSQSPSENPYAQSPTSQDSYADNSSKTSMSSYGSKAPSGLPSGPRAGLPSGPRGGAPVPRPGPPTQQPPPSYGSSVSGGYGSDKYGSGGGYGANRYQNEQNFQQNQNAPVTSQPFRPGGYGGLAGPGGRPQPGGGLGRTESSSTDANRSELFGGSSGRYGSPGGSAYPPPTKPVTGYGQSGASALDSGAYGGYGEERELTEEEKQEQEVENIKAETRYVRGETIASQNRILQKMYESSDLHDDTTARLVSQGERLHNTEKNVDKSENHNASGYEKAKELQTVNRSMFAVHVANPFTAKKRAQARDDAVMDRHRAEKGEREATRAAHWSEAQMMQNSQRLGGLSIEDGGPPAQRFPRKSNKFAFENTEEDDEQEDIIENNFDLMFAATKGLRTKAAHTGELLATQNETIGRIAVKTDRVDDGVRRNRLELDKVR